MLDEGPLIVDGLWQKMVGGGGVYECLHGEVGWRVGPPVTVLGRSFLHSILQTILVALDWLGRTWKGFRSLHGVNL